MGLCDMHVIYIKVVSHLFSIHPSAKPMAQRKKKFIKKKRVTINEEVGKLSNVRSITKTKNTTWLVVLVRIAKNILRML